MGSISDRALTLANEVAEAITQHYGDKYVGICAYNMHSPPPSIRVPHVIISVATSFIRGGYTLDQLIEGWRAQGATLGIPRISGCQRLGPRSARARTRLRPELRHHHHPTLPRAGRFYSAESSDNWGPNGLGYFIAARTLWDLDEAGRREELVARFLSDCFGSAAEPMRTYYELIDGANKPLLCPDLLGRMYGALALAREAAADDEAVLGRINDLVLYTRYVELFQAYSNAEGEVRQRPSRRSSPRLSDAREHDGAHQALYRDLVNRDLRCRSGGRRVNVPETNPWNDSTPFSDGAGDLISEGIANNRWWTSRP